MKFVRCVKMKSYAEMKFNIACSQATNRTIMEPTSTVHLDYTLLCD